jgi:hypothetical protein
MEELIVVGAHLRLDQATRAFIIVFSSALRLPRLFLARRIDGLQVSIAISAALGIIINIFFLFFCATVFGGA